MKTAREIMAQNVITVGPDLPVEQLASMLWENRIHGVPIVARDGTVLGVVTENDLIEQTKKFHIPTAISILDSVIFIDSAKKVEQEIRKMTGSTAMDICTRELVTIQEETPLDEIATIMAEKKVHTLPVLREGRLVGVVGKADVIRTLARKE